MSVKVVTFKWRICIYKGLRFLVRMLCGCLKFNVIVFKFSNDVLEFILLIFRIEIFKKITVAQVIYLVDTEVVHHVDRE